MKLYVKIQKHDAGCERVVLCQFDDADGNKVFVEDVEHNNKQCFKVLCDEGYSRTYYYYPADNFTIVECAIYK